MNFYRVGFYNNISQTKYISLYVEIGFNKNDLIDIDKEYQESIKNLVKVGILHENSIVDSYQVLIMDPAYVHINSKTDLAIKSSLKELEKDNIYLIGRYGRWTYCSMEDCIEMSKALAEKIG